TYLFLETAAGAPIAENDDSGGTRNSRIPATGVLLLAPGTYVIQASSFNAATLGSYSLSVAGPAPGTFLASGRVTANGGALAGVTMAFTGGPSSVLPVSTDSNGV